MDSMIPTIRAIRAHGLARVLIEPGLDSRSLKGTKLAQRSPAWIGRIMVTIAVMTALGAVFGVLAAHLAH